MALHAGQSYRAGTISIGAPDVDLMRRTPSAADVAGDVAHYLATAPDDPHLYYFCIYEQQTPVGQIVLHDINLETGESLIGYCLFEPRLRGRGIGTQALRLLQQYVVEQTELTHLVIITSKDNLASQTIARKCGFRFTGGAWEDPENLMVFEWAVQRSLPTITAMS
jgi:RimJ/RimL family protein N-acetyltransferase